MNKLCPRCEFKVNGAIEKARLYVTSHGLYEMRLNGQRVGDQVFTPGWTARRWSWKLVPAGTGLPTDGEVRAVVVKK